MKIRFEFDLKKILIVGFLTVITMAIKVAFVAIMLNFLEQFYYEFISTDSSFTKIFHDLKTVVFYATFVVFGIDAIMYNYKYIDDSDIKKD